MSQNDMIGLVIATALVSVVVRLMIGNTKFGLKFNETAGKLF